MRCKSITVAEAKIEMNAEKAPVAAHTFVNY